MNDELSLKQGRSLDERFKSRPQVYARLQQIKDMMDQAMNQGCTADQAEAITIEQIRKPGGELLSDWLKTSTPAVLTRLNRNIHKPSGTQTKSKVVYDSF